MVQDDTYTTLKRISQGVYREKSSKFLGIAIPVKSESEVHEQLNSIRKKYHDADHWCFAFRLGYDKTVFRFNDDGEPSGTAGKPIYGQILSLDLTNVLIVVIRYFGGTKLGVSGLISAYKTAAREALNAGETVKKTICNVFEAEFDYGSMNEVMRIVKENHIIEQKFDNTCSVKFSVRKSKSEEVAAKLTHVRNLNLKFLETL